MEAPDKIYINGFSAFATELVKDGEEYIRKDALLEWAKEHKRVIETHGNERNAYLQGEYSMLNSLIDKLNLL